MFSGPSCAGKCAPVHVKPGCVPDGPAVNGLRFNPLIGREYYLYERGDGTDVLSLVAAHEWGRSYQRFVAKARLLALAIHGM